MSRTIIGLDGAWDFFVDPHLLLTHTTLDRDGERRSIQVPGPWQAQFADLRDYAGVAWYRRILETRSFNQASQGDATPCSWLLCFGAVDYHTMVWLNGQPVGEHEGGYLPFELCLDDALASEGPNELVVRVFDPGDGMPEAEYPFDEVPHGKQSWYGPLGGIWQSVRLEQRYPTHLTYLRVTPDVPGAQAQLEVGLSLPVTPELRLGLRLSDPQGATSQFTQQLEAGAQVVRFALPVPEPQLWDTYAPHLYQLEAQLLRQPDEPSAQPEAVDALATQFGMRTIATSPDGHLVLNGRILYLRGALDQDYYPQLIYTPFSDAELDDQFAKAKHMGLNCLRTHIKITDPRYYNAADRAGLLIWTELPNWNKLTAAAKRRARDTLTGMVLRDWNHPCIVIWTIINEGWGVHLMINQDHRSWLAETYQYLKQLDPHRLVVGNSPCFGNFHVVTDIEDFHNYYSIPDHYRKWRDWVQTFAARPSWAFAYTHEGLERWYEYQRDPWSPTPRPPAPEVVRRGNEPMVISEFGNWGLPDVARLKACYGEEPWWFETGIEWGDGVVYAHGIEQRFKAYHLDKVFGTLSNLAAASQRMQFTALKYQIEQMRRQPSIVGYIITEFTDVHWECNGLLDMCRQPKAFYDVIGNINSADAIVPDWERVAFWEGERCEVRVALSHFSSEDLRNCRLDWSLDLWPETAGSFAQIDAAPGSVTTIGTVVFDLPPLAESTRIRLDLRLHNATGELITVNHHELYGFPRAVAQSGFGAGRIYAPELAAELAALGYALADTLAEADLVVAQTMTDQLSHYVHSGGQLLWLADGSEAKQTYLGTLGIAKREGRTWDGDWASNFNWLRQDQLFGAIPTGGTVDFAFADLIPDYVIVGMQPREFADSVYAGLTVGWLHHTVALVAERSYGTGTLLTCTFQLSKQLRTHPVAQIMLGDMLAHLVRPAQDPDTAGS